MRYDFWPQCEDDCPQCNDLQAFNKIASCLDNLIDDKFHCGLPNLKKELAKIDHKLNYVLGRKSKYGLYRIRHEIINCAKQFKNSIPKIEKFANFLTHTSLTLKDMKKEIEQVSKTINNPNFNLKEIRAAVHHVEKEVAKIAETISNPQFGIKEIKSEVYNIEKDLNKIDQVLNNPVFGLKEIKQEIAQMEKKLNTPNAEDHTIKTKVSNMADVVLSPTIGLAKIKEEVAAMENDALRLAGLSEIKSEVSSLENIISNLLPTELLTTGPFLKDAKEQTLCLKALNYTEQPQAVTFILHNLNNCPLTDNAITIPLLNITPCCAAVTEISLGNGQKNLEIQAERSDTNIFIYTATKTGAPGTLGHKRSEIRHSEWTPLANLGK